MNFSLFVRMVSFALLFSLAATVQSSAVPLTPQTTTSSGVGATLSSTKIAVIDIDRIATESAAGKELFDGLKIENDRISQERARREQEIVDMQGKLGSDILSAAARSNLQREIDQKQRDAQRWIEDEQRLFEEKQQAGEQKFQQELGPVVEEVALANGIGLILRATPGLTFVLDPSLDISSLVVEKLNGCAVPGR